MARVKAALARLALRGLDAHRSRILGIYRSVGRVVDRVGVLSICRGVRQRVACDRHDVELTDSVHQRLFRIAPSAVWCNAG